MRGIRSRQYPDGSKADGSRLSSVHLQPGLALEISEG